MLSGCGTTVKEAEQTTPASTVEVDAEDTFGEQTVDQMTENPEAITENENVKEQEKETFMVMRIDDEKLDVTWENNISVNELKELAADGLTISMSMYGGFEQVGPK